MRLLIAEDEMRAREGLRQLIPPAFTQVRTAGNGQEALAIALELKPDVALCDVRMPKLNGIELARQLRLRFPDIHILFISAYSDKEYLKSAISIQADGYLEKPIDEEELLGYLNRIAGEIQSQYSKEKQRNDLADLFARQQILHALLRRDDTQEEALRLNPALTQSVWQARKYLPVSLRMQWPGNSAAAQYGFFSEVKLAGMLSRLSPGYLFASLSESQLGVLFYGEAVPTVADCRRQLIPVLETLRKANPQVLNVCACIGNPCDRLDALYSRYHAAHTQVRWMGFAGSDPCAVGTIPGEVPPIRDRSAQFESLLKGHQLDAAKQLVRAQTDEIIQGGAGSIEQTRQYYELLLNMCLRVNGGGHTDYRNARAGTEIASTFAKLSTLGELCRFLCARVDDIAPSMSLAGDGTALVREVQAYIRQNLADSALSVQDIAEKVGLSENYLSALFKRETGQTLHRVIVDLRIERAKYLLMNRYRVSEVALRCGFSSPGYFHSVFKKHTGLSPAAFVEKNRPGEEG